MLKKSSIIAAAVIAVVMSSHAASAFAQNTNSGATQSTPATTTTTRRRTTTTTTNTNTTTTAPTAAPQDETPRATRTTTTTRASRASRTSRQSETTAQRDIAVRATFDELIDGITRADVDAVMNIYWNSPQLAVFNNNGTVTKTWAQVRANRESAYPKLKDVKIALRDVRVQVLGRDSAVVSYLWTQTQTASGTPESATGRSTLVFQRIGNAWKVVHAHTSPDAPDPSRLLPSEQTETPPPTTIRTPAPTPTSTPRPVASPIPTRP